MHSMPLKRRVTPTKNVSSCVCLDGMLYFKRDFQTASPQLGLRITALSRISSVRGSKGSSPGSQRPPAPSASSAISDDLYLTTGGVIYSRCCSASSFPPSLPNPLSRTASKCTESQLSYSDQRSQRL